MQRIEIPQIIAFIGICLTIAVLFLPHSYFFPEPNFTFAYSYQEK